MNDFNYKLNENKIKNINENLEKNKNSDFKIENLNNREILNHNQIIKNNSNIKIKQNILHEISRNEGKIFRSKFIYIKQILN